MDISALSGASATSGKPLTGAYAGQDVGKEAFLKLLVTQLQNQSPLDPASNEEFLAQLAQFSALENSEAMNDRLGEMAQAQQMAQGAGLIGQRVHYLDRASGETLPGLVGSVELVRGEVLLDVGGSKVALSDVVRVDGAATSE